MRPCHVNHVILPEKAFERRENNAPRAQPPPTGAFERRENNPPRAQPTPRAKLLKVIKSY